MKEDLEEAIKLLKSVRSVRSMRGNTGTVDLIYRTPAMAMREAADRIEYEDSVWARVNKFLEDK